MSLCCWSEPGHTKRCCHLHVVGGTFTRRWMVVGGDLLQHIALPWYVVLKHAGQAVSVVLQGFIYKFNLSKAVIFIMLRKCMQLLRTHCASHYGAFWRAGYLLCDPVSQSSLRLRCGYDQGLLTGLILSNWMRIPHWGYGQSWCFYCHPLSLFISVRCSLTVWMA